MMRTVMVCVVLIGCSEQKSGTPSPAPQPAAAPHPPAKELSCSEAKAHADLVRQVVFSPDGKSLASVGTGPRALKVWTVDGKLAHRLEDRARDFVAFTGDGKLLADDAGKVAVWSLPDGARLRTIGEGGDTITASADGKTVALAGQEYSVVTVWNTGDGTLVRKLEVAPNTAVNLALSPDGRTLAAGGRGDAIRLWDLPDGSPRTLRFRGRGTTTLAVGPDGETLVAGIHSGEPSGLNLYNLRSGKLLAEQKYRSGDDLSLSRDGKLLAVGGQEEVVMLWSLPDGKAVQTLGKDAPGQPKRSRVSPDGQTVAVGAGAEVWLYRVADGSAAGKLDSGRKENVRAFAFSPDGTMLATGDGGGGIALWSLPDGKLVRCLHDPKALPKPPDPNAGKPAEILSAPGELPLRDLLAGVRCQNTMEMDTWRTTMACTLRSGNRLTYMADPDISGGGMSPGRYLAEISVVGKKVVDEGAGFARMYLDEAGKQQLATSLEAWKQAAPAPAQWRIGAIDVAVGSLLKGNEPTGQWAFVIKPVTPAPKAPVDE